ncbi:MAG: large repetitive protein [Acidobacteriota bacterium]|jgi:membrane-associated phospholipid phosphatase|nr:large repetitive protein [Acidobacteriota bacterium]
MLRRSLRVSLVLAALLGTAGVARANVVTDWNNVLLQAIRVDKTPPPIASRAMAMVHVAVFDAVNGLVGDYAPYAITGRGPGGASPEASAIAAAHKVLVALFPAQKATFDAAYATSLAPIFESTGKAAGITWGEAVATTVLALRANDGATATVPYNVPTGAFWWAPTPPAFATVLLPQWPSVTPWAINNPDRFVNVAPPTPSSAEYTRAFNEVKRLGRDTSGARTPEQTRIALFWADGAGTATPPGHWNLVAQNLTVRQALNISQSSYLFAILNIAEADAAIVAWDYKYRYSFWRPVAAIRNAEIDGNPATTADPTWTPLLVTPPFPSYISGHSTFSGAAAKVLALFFGTDNVSFSTTSDALPGVTRSFTSFSQAAAEAGQSRIYGGIHFQFDNVVGLAAGAAVGQEAFYNVVTPLAPIAPCHGTDTTLCLDGNRYQVSVQWDTGTAKGAGHAVPFTDDSGRFWFFDPNNTEVVVKVVNACSAFGNHWVFLSGLTNVEVLVMVTDTQTGRVRTYANPRGTAFMPVQDTKAFACP